MPVYSLITVTLLNNQHKILIQNIELSQTNMMKEHNSESLLA